MHKVNTTQCRRDGVGSTWRFAPVGLELHWGPLGVVVMGHGHGSGVGGRATPLLGQQAPHWSFCRCMVLKIQLLDCSPFRVQELVACGRMEGSLSTVPLQALPAERYPATSPTHWVHSCGEPLLTPCLVSPRMGIWPEVLLPGGVSWVMWYSGSLVIVMILHL